MKWLITILILAAVLIAGYTQNKEQPYEYGNYSNLLISGFNFFTENGTCAYSQNYSTAYQNRSDNGTSFYGYVLTPNPCYGLNASYSVIRYGDFRDPQRTSMYAVYINITKVKMQDVCVECIGKIPFHGYIMVNKEIANAALYSGYVLYIDYEGNHIDYELKG